MRTAMDERTFLNFYKNTVLGYSKSLQRYVCDLLEEDGRITFERQRSLFDSDDKAYFESKKDCRSILVKTTTDKHFSDFFEKWEFIKLYKYSVPLFYELPEGKDLRSLIIDSSIPIFMSDSFALSYVINSSLKDADYFDGKNKCLEIRYDSPKYRTSFHNEEYEAMVNDCIEWMIKELKLVLFECEHTNIIDVVNDKQNEAVKMYKQMMELSSGGAAELTASESADYVLPFIGEIRELIDENEELFSRADEVKQLLLQYLEDKEATARYPYIYVKWVKPVESQSYVVKVIFEYLNHKHTSLQHITGSCKDLGMERMNNAIEYLCQSGSFTKGQRIE